MTIPESDIIYFTVQILREHNLLALDLGLKYEIQVPNIGGGANALYPQPNYLGAIQPPASLIAPAGVGQIKRGHLSFLPRDAYA